MTELVSALIRRWLKGAPNKSRFSLTREQLRSLLAEIDGPEREAGEVAGPTHRAQSYALGVAGMSMDHRCPVCRSLIVIEDHEQRCYQCLACDHFWATELAKSDRLALVDDRG